MLCMWKSSWFLICWTYFNQHKTTILHNNCQTCPCGAIFESHDLCIYVVFIISIVYSFIIITCFCQSDAICSSFIVHTFVIGPFSSWRLKFNYTIRCPLMQIHTCAISWHVAPGTLRHHMVSYLIYVISSPTGRSL